MEGGKRKGKKMGERGPGRARLLHGQRGHAAHAHASGGTDAGRRSPPLRARATDGKREKGGWRLPAASGGRRRSFCGRWRVEGGPGARPAAFSSSLAAPPDGVGSQQLSVRRGLRWLPAVLGTGKECIRRRRGRGTQWNRKGGRGTSGMDAFFRAVWW
jgi:hypothetical protein